MPADQSSDAHVRRTEVLAAIDRFRDMLWSRDISIVGEFAEEADILLVGSDDGEVAGGPAEIGALLRGLFDLPVRLRWDWRRRTVSIVGDVAWFFADCEVVIRSEDSETRKPYRMTGVLQRIAGHWKWRQFHGSEPAS